MQNKSENRLKQLRLERGLTIKEVANYIGVSQGSYNYYELGKTEPSFEKLKALSNLFCVSIDYLVGHHASTPAPMGEPLSKNEEELLSAFRTLGVFEQGSILVQVNALAEQARAIKK